MLFVTRCRPNGT